MMALSKKTKNILIVIGGAGLLAVVGASAYAYQNVNEEPPVVVEQQSAEEVQEQHSHTDLAPTILRQGNFMGTDAIHRGEGVAKIVAHDGKVHLDFENFKVTNGPDLFVYLSPNAPGEDLGAFASLGELKSPSGNQVYNLPENHQDYKTVVIWCRAFNVTFATAELK